MSERPIDPGMIVGILGGGQLGRMLALAAAELGLSCHIFCPDPKSPAFAVAAARTIAPYEDEAALAHFAGASTSSLTNSRTFRPRPWTFWRAA